MELEANNLGLLDSRNRGLLRFALGLLDFVQSKEDVVIVPTLLHVHDAKSNASLV